MVVDSRLYELKAAIENVKKALAHDKQNPELLSKLERLQTEKSVEEEKEIALVEVRKRRDNQTQSPELVANMKQTWKSLLENRKALLEFDKMTEGILKVIGFEENFNGKVKSSDGHEYDLNTFAKIHLERINAKSPDEKAQAEKKLDDFLASHSSIVNAPKHLKVEKKAELNKTLVGSLVEQREKRKVIVHKLTSPENQGKFEALDMDNKDIHAAKTILNRKGGSLDSLVSDHVQVNSLIKNANENVKKTRREIKQDLIQCEKDMERQAKALKQVGVEVKEPYVQTQKLNDKVHNLDQEIKKTGVGSMISAMQTNEPTNKKQVLPTNKEHAEAKKKEQNKAYTRTK